MINATTVNTTHELMTAIWRKSSRSGSGSGGGGDCIEVAITARLVGIRDSKNPSKGLLAFSPAQWKGLIRGVKNGKFDL
jgi:Domain of unknown function (DUF397)